MGNYNLNFTLVFLFLFFFIFIFQTSAQEDDLCQNVNCGKGTCKISSDSVTGFECACAHGWKRIIPLPFSSCTVHWSNGVSKSSRNYLVLNMILLFVSALATI